MTPMSFQSFLAALAPLVRRWPSAMDPERQALVWDKWKHVNLEAFRLGIEKIIYDGGYAPSGKRIDDAVSAAWGEYKNKYFSPSHPPHHRTEKRLSDDAKKHPEWRDANATKYSPKMIGIYNTVQRAILTNDTRGMKGITLVCHLSPDEAFKIYELMREGNTTHELITKNNNILFSI